MLNNLFDDRNKFTRFFRTNSNDTLKNQIVTTDKLRYWYCRWVKDRKEFWAKIRESEWAYTYCVCVKDRLEVRRYITDPSYARAYCNSRGRDPEVWKHVTLVDRNE